MKLTVEPARMPARPWPSGGRYDDLDDAFEASAPEDEDEDEDEDDYPRR